MKWGCSSRWRGLLHTFTASRPLTFCPGCELCARPRAPIKAGWLTYKRGITRAAAWGHLTRNSGPSENIPTGTLRRGRAASGCRVCWCHYRGVCNITLHAPSPIFIFLGSNSLKTEESLELEGWKLSWRCQRSSLGNSGHYLRGGKKQNCAACFSPLITASCQNVPCYGLTLRLTDRANVFTFCTFYSCKKFNSFTWIKGRKYRFWIVPAQK